MVKPSIMEQAATEADLSLIPAYIRDYVPEDALRRRLALQDPRVLHAASSAVNSALAEERLAPKDAHEILYMQTEQVLHAD